MIQKIIQIVCDAADIPPEWVSPDTDLTEACFIDSLDMLQIFEDVEAEFRVKFPEEAIDELRTVNEIASYLRRG